MTQDTGPTIDRVHEKQCPRCQMVKPLGEFSKNRTAADGHRGYCRVCDAAWKRDARRRQREALGLPPRFDPAIDRAKEKRCVRCRAVKPLEAFDRDRSRKDGHSIYCQPCAAAMAQAVGDRRRAARGLPPKARPPAGLDHSTKKWCPGCLAVKPLDAFYRNRSSSHGYYSRCKTCIKAERRALYARKRAARDLPPNPMTKE